MKAAFDLQSSHVCEKRSKYQAPVAQTLDSALNRCPMDRCWGNQLRYLGGDRDSFSGQRYVPFEQLGPGQDETAGLANPCEIVQNGGQRYPVYNALGFPNSYPLDSN